MAMSLIVGTHYLGQTSWWLNAENHRVVAWAGRTFDSAIAASQAADDFKKCSATAEFEIHDAAHGMWRWRAWHSRQQVAVSATGFTTKQLTDDNLRCTVKEYSKWVEKALGISDLRSRLQAGEAVVAFDFRRDQLRIKWLKQFLNAGFSVSEGGSRRWLVSLVYPTGILALVEVVDGWDVHNEWRWALPPT
jgi:uncharacterized protein YegP (UPF0339 family)